MRYQAQFISALLALLSAPAIGEVAPERPALLIVGVPHFANPGRDLVNLRIADVTVEERQREIEKVIERLAAFGPTRVAVEWPASRQNELDKRFADYVAGNYALSPNEIDQIGLRLARRLGLKRVDAVDWNDMPPGKEADYDFVAWAEANGRSDDWKARLTRSQADADTEAQLMACTPVSSWIRRLNTPDARTKMQRPYYEIAAMGDAKAQPGAAWVGSWYARNLRILNNIRALANTPDERIIVIYGAGHGYLLDQQARESASFNVVDPLVWLPSSSRDDWSGCPK